MIYKVILERKEGLELEDVDYRMGYDVRCLDFFFLKFQVLDLGYPGMIEMEM